MPINFVAKAAITAALVATQYAIQASTKIEGPRLDETKVTLGDYGVSLQRVWGTRRIEGPPIFFAEDLREVKRRRKTKGGKYNEYTYFGTWAIAVAGHEIADVTRIWLDKKLVYQVTGAGPITPFEGDEGVNLSDYIRIYKGTEDQEADPRMLATVEAANGAGSCPAYRGTAYVMFVDVPLEKFGNRIPQAATEVVSVTAPVYPFESFDTIATNLSSLSGATFSSDYQTFTWASSSQFETWDIPSRTRIRSGNLAYGINTQSVLGLYNDGSFLAYTFTDIRRFNADGTGGTVFYTGPFFPGGVRVLADENGDEHWVAWPSTYLDREFAVDGVAFNCDDYFSSSFVSWAFADAEGSIWVAAGEIGSGSTTCNFLRVLPAVAATGPSIVTATGLFNSGGGVGKYVAALHYKDETHDQFILSWEGHTYAIDRFTGAVLVDNASLVLIHDKQQFAAVKAGDPTIWLGAFDVSEVRLSDLTVVRTVDDYLWKIEDATGAIYDRINNALICAPSSDPIITWRYLDRISSDGVTLETIANDVADMCGILEYDFSAFTQTVGGWSATIGTGQDILEPLLDAYDVDIRPHDFSIQGVVRGGSSGGSIDVERFVRNGNEPRYTVKIAQAAQIPRAMVMNFADLDKEQQVNSVRVSRPPEATEAAGEATLDMTTWATDTDTARQFLARYFRRMWNGREMINNALTPQNLAIEPADLRTLGLDGENVLARLIKTSLAKDGKMASEWVTDDPDLALLDGGEGPTFDGFEPSQMLIPQPSRGFVIDANLATDSHEQTNPFMYFAAAPYASGFYSGTDFYASDTPVLDDYVPGWAAVSSSDAMDWGYCTNELGDALPWIFDNGTVLNVKMQIGSLSGVTEAEILDDPTLNLLLIEANGGWEYVQYVDADLQGDGSYNVTGLLRGCRGTEHLISQHSAGNVVIVVDNDVFRRTVGASEIGDTDYYRPVAQGRSVTSASEQVVTFTAAANKPYAPVHGTLENVSDDWIIDATRRTRIGGANVDGGDVPLGETAQSWEADIMDGADVVRTISGASLPLTYLAADQTTDFGALQTSLDVNLYQVSPALSLRGYELNIAA